MEAHPAVNKKLIEKILNKSVKSLTVTEGSRPGDNFICVLFGIEVLLEDEEKPLYLLMKACPSHPARQKFLEETNLFMKEVLVYKVLLAEYKKMQEKMGNDIIIFPSLPPFIEGNAVDYSSVSDLSEVNLKIENLLCVDKIENYLLMVDTRKTSGFKMADKFAGLDFEHCKLVMVELAKLHSLSLAYKHQQGLKHMTDRFPFLEETLFTEKSKAFLDPVLQNNFKLVSDIAAKSFGEDNGTMKSIKNLEENAINIMDMFINKNGVDEGKAANLMRVQPLDKGPRAEDQWIVASHGDCWINNVMFKYNNQTQKPIETMLVDFQLCREACLTVDLAYFFYSSTDENLRAKHLHDLLQIYHDSFIGNCKVLKTKPFPGFTLNNLKARFRRSKILGFIFSVLVLPIILKRNETAVDLDMVEPTSGNETNLSDLLQSGARNEFDDQLMSNRFVGMIKELITEGIF